MRIGKDAVSRVAQRLEEELSAWRGRPLELAYPYLYLDAAYFKVNWGGRVVDLALLMAVGVNEEGYREVLTVEPAGGERKEAWRNLLKGLVERGLRGVRLVIPFYANAFVLGHQWKRVCRLRVSGSWARTRHRSATTSIISSRS